MRKENTCGAILKQIHDALEKNANNGLRSQGITMVQVSMLMALEDAPDGQRSLKELEQLFHVAQSTTAGVVARLEQKGLVEGFKSSEDKRIKMVRITSAGRECCRHTEQHMIEMEERLVSGLTEEENSMLYSLLQKVCDALQ